jgi:hypothetical protein
MEEYALVLLAVEALGSVRVATMRMTYWLLMDYDEVLRVASQPKILSASWLSEKRRRGKGVADDEAA